MLTLLSLMDDAQGLGVRQGEKRRRKGPKRREEEGNKINERGLERRRKPRQRGGEFSLEVTRADSLLSTTTWAASEHTKEFRRLQTAPFVAC